MLHLIWSEQLKTILKLFLIVNISIPACLTNIVWSLLFHYPHRCLINLRVFNYITVTQFTLNENYSVTEAIYIWLVIPKSKDRTILFDHTYTLCLCKKIYITFSFNYILKLVRHNVLSYITHKIRLEKTFTSCSMTLPEITVFVYQGTELEFCITNVRFR